MPDLFAWFRRFRSAYLEARRLRFTRLALALVVCLTVVPAVAILILFFTQSHADLENAVMGHPAVAEAAVIAIPDAKWGERPLACVVKKPGQSLAAEELDAHLLGKGFAKWQLPDRYEWIDAVPRTSTGKFWKLTLRERYAH